MIRLKGWSYLESVYFSIISLTKVGFGDFVPHTQPADKWAMWVFIGNFMWQYDIFRHKHNKTRCISALVSTSPRTGASEFKRLFDACAGPGSTNKYMYVLVRVWRSVLRAWKESTWSPEVERCFVLYRVLIFFWILFGITFTCSVIHLMCRSINVFLL